MASTESTELPSVGALLAPLLQTIPREDQPLLIAYAERLAAQRYRRWAEASPAHRAELLACADREEEIATRIEGVYPGAAALQRELIESHPQVETINRELFEGRPLREQFAIQSAGEKLGAATWRSFARHHDAARQTFLDCAALEEASAAVLDSVLAKEDSAV